MNRVVIAETVRRHFSSRGYGVFVVFITLAGVLAATFHIPASLWPSLASMLAIITGSALIGPEFSNGALQLVVSRPIRRPVYFVSRIVGVHLAVLAAVLPAMFAEAIARAVFRGEVPFERLGVVFLGTALTTFLTASLLAFLGALTRSYFNVAIYLGAQVVLAFTQAFLGMMSMRPGAFARFLADYDVGELLVAFDSIMFPEQPPEMTATWVLRVLATAVVFIALGCLAFDRREVPYGPD